MQKIAKQARLLERWQRYQRLTPGRDDVQLPILEAETTVEPCCACSSPVVMWEGEYFCVVTGDLSDKCSLAVPALIRSNDESECRVRQS